MSAPWFASPGASSDLPDVVVCTIYEPRWHGFARWEIKHLTHRSDSVAIARGLESGWIRRRRGSRAIECEVTNPRWASYYLTGDPEDGDANNQAGSHT